MRDTHDRSTKGRRTASARTALATGLIALGTATVLNAGSLLETAERQSIDHPARAAAVEVMESIVRFGEFTRLDKPRDVLETLLGRGENTQADQSSGDPLQEVADTTTSTTTITSTTTTTPNSDTTEPEAGATSTSTSTTTSTTTTTTTIPKPTAEDPLTLWIIGDSFMELLGPAIRNDGFETGFIEAEVDFRFISGLVRPDYFDWPAHISSQMPNIEPDAVVVMFGGNDGQPFRDPEGWVPVGTEEWHERHAAVVGEVMDLLLDLGATRVYWIGLPIMRSAKFTEKIIGMNGDYRAEAARRPGVVYISSFELFQDEDAEYSTYLKDEDGSLQRMRAADGAHLLWPGAYRLAAVVIDTVATEWRIPLPNSG